VALKGEVVEPMKRQKKAAVAPQVLTVREVSEYLRIHPTTVYRLLRSRQIPGFRVGGEWRFDSENIDALGSRGRAKRQ
jgi:excisionase family DNA binding protein